MDKVIIVNYDPQWPQLFSVETAGLYQAFGTMLIALQHIGSTSVPGLAAKPVVDIQAIVRTVSEAQNAASVLAEAGWSQGIFDLDPERRLYFKKQNASGVRTHQLHVYAPDHPAAADHLLFRDTLRRDPDEAARYLDLKRHLAEAHRYDPIAYSHAKTDYVEAILVKARG